jgi:hypothetical protein
MDIYTFYDGIKLTHPMYGLVGCKPLEYQKNLLDEYEKDRITLVLKSRQMGITTLNAIYALWYVFTRPNSNIGFYGIHLTHGIHWLDLVREIYKSLPINKKLDIKTWNKTQITFKNDSQICILNQDRTRGLSLDFVIFDELAFHIDIQDLWMCILASFSCLPKIIIATSLNYNDTRGEFSEFCKNVLRHPRVHLEVLPYYLHPDRNREWSKDYINLIGNERFYHEFLDINKHVDYSKYGGINILWRLFNLSLKHADSI